MAPCHLAATVGVPSRPSPAARSCGPLTGHHTEGRRRRRAPKSSPRQDLRSCAGLWLDSSHSPAHDPGSRYEVTGVGRATTSPDGRASMISPVITSSPVVGGGFRRVATASA